MGSGNVIRPDLVGWMRARLADALGVAAEAVDPDQGFFSLGLDSLRLVELSDALERHLHREIPSALLFEHPTIAELADHLSRSSPRGAGDVPAGATAPSEAIAIVGVACRMPGGNASAVPASAEFLRYSRRVIMRCAPVVQPGRCLKISIVLHATVFSDRQECHRLKP